MSIRTFYVAVALFALAVLALFFILNATPAHAYCYEVCRNKECTVRACQCTLPWETCGY